MIHRSIEDNIRKALDGKKAVTIMGARQVGKSTLTEALFSGEENVLFLEMRLMYAPSSKTPPQPAFALSLARQLLWSLTRLKR